MKVFPRLLAVEYYLTQEPRRSIAHNESTYTGAARAQASSYERSEQEANEPVDMKFEIVVIPVGCGPREGLLLEAWLRLDADYAHVTTRVLSSRAWLRLPVIFGKNVTRGGTRLLARPVPDRSPT